MISYIFLHIPKTGGSSFRTNITKSGIKNVRMGHLTYFGMEKDGNEAERLPIPKYVVFIRCPIKRNLSHYREMALNKDTPFEHWFEEKYHNFQAKFLNKAILGNENEPTRGELDKIKEVLSTFFFVGVTDKLDRDLAPLLRKIGASPVNSLLHINKSKKQYKPAESDKELILKHSKLDSELYEFAKELNEKTRRNLK